MEGGWQQTAIRAALRANWIEPRPPSELFIGFWTFTSARHGKVYTETKPPL
uniref:hypothetical protein n=1 Tax=Salmonella sp. TaxID=599 RepID=UPI001CD9D3DA|nr:hypothetical protein [Salmonella sp.]